MGFKLVEAVYRLRRDLTSSSEQAVLLALAFRANDKTLLCYPKQETLSAMTHLSRSAVAKALNTLKRNGIIDWNRGGASARRGKYGQTLSNDYKLKLPMAAPKSEKSDGGNVLQKDMAMSSTKTKQCPPGGQGDVLHEDTNRKIQHNTTPIPNRRESGSDSVFDKALRSMGIEVPQPGREEDRKAPRREDSPLLTALDVCGLTPGTDRYRSNYRAFAGAMLQLGMERSMEIVRAFASELRQGEMDNVRNLPALLMTRLKA